MTSKLSGGRLFGLATIVALAWLAGRLGAPGAVSTAAYAQDTGAASPEATMEDDELAAWLDAVHSPGEMHERLEPLIGTFVGTARLWDGPDSEPTELTFNVKREWILGGRFVKVEVDVPGPSDEETFRGLSFIGYNMIDGQYEVVWMENSRTAMFREAGRFEGDTPVFNTLGRHRDPLSGAFVYTSTKLDLSDRNRHHLTGMNNDLGGVSYKSLDATLVRQQ